MNKGNILFSFIPHYLFFLSFFFLVYDIAKNKAKYTEVAP